MIITLFELPCFCVDSARSQMFGTPTIENECKSGKSKLEALTPIFPPFMLKEKVQKSSQLSEDKYLVDLQDRINLVEEVRASEKTNCACQK